MTPSTCLAAWLGVGHPPYFSSSSSLVGVASVYIVKRIPPPPPNQAWDLLQRARTRKLRAVPRSSLFLVLLTKYEALALAEGCGRERAGRMLKSQKSTSSESGASR